MSALASPTKPSLIREVADLKFRALDGDNAGVLAGSFGPLDQWVEINSRVEGHFMERFAPGCYDKTFRERADKIRCLHRHGRDPLVGQNPIGKILRLFEDGEAARYEVELFDGLPTLVLNGYRAGQYGSSHLFAPIPSKVDFVARPRRSEHNPDGLAEFTYREVYVHEFGPTPFPVYHNTTASMRSATDEWILEKFTDEDPRGNATAAIPAAVQREEPTDFMYARTVERVGATVWAMHPTTLQTVLEIISERANGHRPSDEEIRERIGVREDTADTSASPVAVIPVRGPIVPHAGMVDATSSELVSVEGIRSQFQEALNDPEVGAILFNIDSPGGDSSLIPELSAEIRAARGDKPIVAFANTWAASAAYHLAVSADEIVVTPSGEVGSIGVYSAHSDLSAAQEKLGVKTTLVSAGKYKVERNPFEPLSDDAQAYMQEQVDAVYEMFVSDVAKGRGVPTSEVRDGFGEGRMVKATKAVELGMADRVATYDETIARLTKLAARSRETETTEPEPPEATTPDKSTPEPPEATTRDLAKPRTVLPRTGAESLTPEKERLP